MNIIVTGGAGFIGSEFVRMLAEKPENQILVLDNLTYAGNLANIFEEVKSGHEKTDYTNYENKNIVFQKIDISDPEARLDKIFDSFKPDYVVNFAAESHVDNSLNAPSMFLQSNTNGVSNLLHYCNEYHKSRGLKKVVQISTDEVYGSLSRDEEPWLENAPLYPRNHYSASKAAAEMVANAYFETEGLPVVITRSSNNYGPYQYPEKLVPLFVTNILLNKKIPVYGDGTNIRDWLHVRDNCEAIYAAMRMGSVGQTYNIAGENERTNIEITNLILNFMKQPHSAIEYVKDRKGHDFRYAVNCDKIKNELKWRPKINFTHGLQAVVEWYTNNGKWWKPLKTMR